MFNELSKERTNRIFIFRFRRKIKFCCCSCFNVSCFVIQHRECKNVKSNFSFCCREARRGEKGKLLCWLIDFFFAFSLVDGITMIAEFDFCPLASFLLLNIFHIRDKKEESTNWVLIVCLPPRVLVDGIFDNVQMLLTRFLVLRAEIVHQVI